MKGTEMREFSEFHPIVSFIFFAAVMVLSMFFMHPVCLLISLAGGFSYSVVLKGKKAIREALMIIIPIILLSAVINPLFNHEGATILAYLPGGNPLTAESIAYGFASGTMLASVICWFSCCNVIMTSDKYIYLFGRLLPSLSLIFSMILRFVPRFSAQMKAVSDTQSCMGRGIKEGSIIKRAKNGISILSIMLTWALENSVDTADSMRARGYGLSGRTAFSVFRFDRRDFAALFLILLSAAYVTAGAALGELRVSYFPVFSIGVSHFGISVFAVYAILCAMPIIIEIRESYRWFVMKSKI